MGLTSQGLSIECGCHQALCDQDPTGHTRAFPGCPLARPAVGRHPSSQRTDSELPCSSFSEHANYFGVDEKLGPVAVSIKREKLEDHKDHGPQYQYRIIFRTREVGLVTHVTVTYVTATHIAEPLLGAWFCEQALPLLHLLQSSPQPHKSHPISLPILQTRRLRL